MKDQTQKQVEKNTTQWKLNSFDQMRNLANFRERLVKESSASILEEYDSFQGQINAILKSVYKGEVEPFVQGKDTGLATTIVGLFVFVFFVFLPWLIGMIYVFKGN